MAVPPTTRDQGTSTGASRAGEGGGPSGPGVPPPATAPGKPATGSLSAVLRGGRSLLAWALALGLVFYVFRKTDVHALREALGRVEPGPYLAFSGFFCALNLVLDAFAGTRVFRRVGAAVRFDEYLVVRGASYLPGLVNQHVGQAYLTYLVSRRHGLPLADAAGGTLLSYASILGALGAVNVGSLVLPPDSLPQMRIVAAVFVVVGVAYLAVIALAPPFLAARPVVGTLFRAGVQGHVAVLAARLPHVAVLVASTWMSYRFFLPALPASAAVTAVPAVLLLAALPVTPMGVGTRDVAALRLIGAFAAVGATGSATASVLAATAAWLAVTTAWSAIIGLLLFRRASRVLSD